MIVATVVGAFLLFFSHTNSLPLSFLLAFKAYNELCTTQFMAITGVVPLGSRAGFEDYDLLLVSPAVDNVGLCESSRNLPGDVARRSKLYKKLICVLIVRYT